MSQWSRREALAALAQGGLLAYLPSWACAGSQEARRSRAAPREDLQGELDRVFAQAAEKLEEPRIWVRTRRRSALLVDSREVTWSESYSRWAVLSGQSAGLVHELTVENPSPGELEGLVRDFLVDLASRPPPRPRARSRARATTGPSAGARSQLVVDGTALYERSLAHGGSRIVYRAAQLEHIDDEHFFMDEAGSRAQQQRRQRAGLTMIAWTGDTVAADRAERGVIGAAAPVLSDAVLEATAKQALAHLHARGAPEAGAASVILSPVAAALFVHQCIAMPALTGRRAAGFQVQSIPESLNIRCLPEVSIGFGGYVHDDAGTLARAADLVAGGAFVNFDAAGTGHLRRDDRAMLRPWPSNVVMAAGDADPEELIAAIEHGVLLEGPVSATLDQRAELATLVMSRGQEIKSGRLTGRVFGRMIVRKPLVELLGGTLAIGNQREARIFEGDGLASGALAPHWALRAQCEAA